MLSRRSMRGPLPMRMAQRSSASSTGHVITYVTTRVRSQRPLASSIDEVAQLSYRALRESGVYLDLLVYAVAVAVAVAAVSFIGPV